MLRESLFHLSEYKDNESSVFPELGLRVRTFSSRYPRTRSPFAVA